MQDGAADRNASWRARIGVIVPVSNTMNEVEFNRMAPSGVTVHCTREPLHKDPGADDFRAMLHDAARSAEALAACKVDVIAYGCTANSMACPADRLLGTMEKAGGTRSVTTAGAILAALKALGVRRIAMATPYTQATNDHEVEFLHEHGIEVVAHAGLGLNVDLAGIQKISRVPPEAVLTHARSVDRKEADALLICCTDFGALPVVDRLEKELGKPVITSNTATFWAALRTAGVKDKVPGCGRLLAEH
ncbi:MAG: decarboxylase [Alphaproteobacteria bacterium]|nr:decarboxylase [Alphaproteobacteria bacterium]